MGRPPARGLATVMTSGVMPLSSYAHNAPVAPHAALNLVTDQQGVLFVAKRAQALHRTQAWRC